MKTNAATDLLETLVLRQQITEKGPDSAVISWEIAGGYVDPVISLNPQANIKLLFV